MREESDKASLSRLFGMDKRFIEVENIFEEGGNRR